MFRFLKNLFGGTSVDFAELVKNGAQIIDVRTPAELAEGSIDGHVMMNIMDPSFPQKLQELNKDVPYYVTSKSTIR